MHLSRAGCMAATPETLNPRKERARARTYQLCTGRVLGAAYLRKLKAGTSRQRVGHFRSRLKRGRQLGELSSAFWKRHAWRARLGRGACLRAM